MTEQFATTPFGRRPVTLGQIAAHMQVRKAIDAAGQPGSNTPAAVNKWAVYRTLTEIKDRLGLSDRSLSVLNALLSFQQETALSLPVRTPQADGETGEGASCDLVVFPSNRALCLRAHGMSEPTLRRHLAALIAAGLIARRDSPNGKRYARKDRTGRERFSDAFGFDLTPLVARVAEFETIADDVRRERDAIRALKERITLHRRDIAKLIECGVDAGLSGPWAEFSQRFMRLLTPLRQIKGTATAGEMAAELANLRAEVARLLEEHANEQDISGNDARSERHQSNSKTQPLNVEPTSKTAGGEIEPILTSTAPSEAVALPVGMVLDACPDVSAFQFDGAKITTWPAFITAARTIRPMLGVSPDAWKEAVAALGERDAAIAIAAILQRSEHSSEAVASSEAGSGMIVNGSPAIRSAGGYLRALTEQAKAGQFAVGPMLMALIGQRLKSRGLGRERGAPNGSSPGGSFR